MRIFLKMTLVQYDRTEYEKIIHILLHLSTTYYLRIKSCDCLINKSYGNCRKSFRPLTGQPLLTSVDRLVDHLLDIGAGIELVQFAVFAGGIHAV